MNVWMIASVMLLIAVIIGGIFIVSAQDVEEQKPVVKSCGSCGGGCSAGGSCGSSSCGATTGGSCGCGSK